MQETKTLKREANISQIENSGDSEILVWIKVIIYYLKNANFSSFRVNYISNVKISASSVARNQIR